MLSGVCHQPDSVASSAGVVFCHGMESNKDSAKIVEMSRFLSGQGLVALRFDFAGCGDSLGSFEEISYAHEVEDLHAAVAYLESTGVERFGLLGSSMGGSVALLYAGSSEHPESVAAVATMAAPSDPLEIVAQFATPEELAAWERKGFTDYHGRRINRTLLDDIRAIDIVGAAKRIPCPVLLIHGDADRTVPVCQARRLYETLGTRKELLILPGGDHRFSEPGDMRIAVDASQDWMLRHLRAP